MLYRSDNIVITKAFSSFTDDSSAEAPGPEKANPNPESVYSSEDILLTLHEKGPSII